MATIRIKQIPFLILLHVIVIAMIAGLVMRKKGLPGHGKEKIVVVPVDGIITTGSRAGKEVDPDELAKYIKDLREDDNVKAIVLRINSPGGSVGAVQEIYDGLQKFRQKGKVVVASFADVSASGGYYLACAADKIVAHPGTLTGSIGVIMQFPNVEGLLTKIGVSMQNLKSGSMKDAGSPFRKMTEQERAYFATVINDAYSQFYQAVKDGRKLDDAALKTLADGRVFSGRMALDKKLIDQLGSLEEAIDEAKKLAKIENKNPEVVYHEESRSLGRLLKLISRSPAEALTALTDRGETKLLYMMP